MSPFAMAKLYGLDQSWGGSDNRHLRSMTASFFQSSWSFVEFMAELTQFDVLVQDRSSECVIHCKEKRWNLLAENGKNFQIVKNYAALGTWFSFWILHDRITTTPRQPKKKQIWSCCFCWYIFSHFSFNIFRCFTSWLISNEFTPSARCSERITDFWDF